jgi:ABC-type antimicrobial peptide transport system permease subunit
MTLSAIGGVIGVVVGLAIAALVRNGSPLANATPLWSIVVGLMVSISIGVFFDIYPATKAATLDPIEALRYIRELVKPFVDEFPYPPMIINSTFGRTA